MLEKYSTLNSLHASSWFCYVVYCKAFGNPFMEMYRVLCQNVLSLTTISVYSKNTWVIFGAAVPWNNIQ